MFHAASVRYGVDCAYCVCFMPSWLIEQYWTASVLGDWRQNIILVSKINHSVGEEKLSPESRTFSVGALYMRQYAKQSNMFYARLKRHGNAVHTTFLYGIFWANQCSLVINWISIGGWGFRTRLAIIDFIGNTLKSHRLVRFWTGIQNVVAQPISNAQHTNIPFHSLSCCCCCCCSSMLPLSTFHCVCLYNAFGLAEAFHAPIQQAWQKRERDHQRKREWVCVCVSAQRASMTSLSFCAVPSPKNSFPHAHRPESEYTHVHATSRMIKQNQPNATAMAAASTMECRTEIDKYLAIPLCAHRRTSHRIYTASHATHIIHHSFGKIYG